MSLRFFTTLPCYCTFSDFDYCFINRGRCMDFLRFATYLCLEISVLYLNNILLNSCYLVCSMLHNYCSSHPSSCKTPMRQFCLTSQSVYSRCKGFNWELNKERCEIGCFSQLFRTYLNIDQTFAEFTFCIALL